MAEATTGVAVLIGPSRIEFAGERKFSFVTEFVEMQDDVDLEKAAKDFIA